MKKLICILVLGLLWGGNAYADCTIGNCIKGKSTYVFPSGNIYEGEFKNGKRHGKGVFIWSDGRKYVGKYKDSKKNGRGTLTYPDGKIMKGKWKNNMFVN